MFVIKFMSTGKCAAFKSETSEQCGTDIPNVPVEHLGGTTAYSSSGVEIVTDPSGAGVPNADVASDSNNFYVECRHS